MINETIDNQQVTKIDIGWLAGIIDGEGWLGLTYQNKKRNRFSVKAEIQVVNTDKGIVDYFVLTLSQLGITPYIRVREYKTSSWRPCWNITLGKFSAVVKLLTAVGPFLRGEKRKKADILLQFCGQRLQKGRQQYDADDLKLIAAYNQLVITSTTIPKGSRVLVDPKRTATP